MIVVQIIKQTVDLQVFRIHLIAKDPKGMIEKICHDTRWSNTSVDEIAACPPWKMVLNVGRHQDAGAHPRAEMVMEFKGANGTGGSTFGHTIGDGDDAEFVAVKGHIFKILVGVEKERP